MPLKAVKRPVERPLKGLQLTAFIKACSKPSEDLLKPF